MLKKLIFAMLIISIAGCNKDKDENYPIIYNYKDIAYSSTKLYYIDANKNLKEIAMQGVFADFDEDLKFLLPELIQSEEYIKSIKLIDDKQGQITYIDDSKASFSYVLNGQTLTINNGSSGEIIDLSLVRVDNKDVIKVPMCISRFSYKKSNKLDYSPYNNDECTSTDPKALAQEVMTTYKLTTNDTIGISMPAILFEKQ